MPTLERGSVLAKHICILLAVILPLSWVFAHQNHVHKSKPVLSPSQENRRAAKLNEINEEYKERVKSIFQKSCFDCHSQQTRYPWYYKIPGAKGLIDSDLAEAKKHIDLTNDFPFHGHGSPEEDLSAIRKAVEENTMPPFRYRILHPGANLNKTEREAILQWIKESLDQLSK